MVLGASLALVPAPAGAEEPPRTDDDDHDRYDGG